MDANQYTSINTLDTSPIGEVVVSKRKEARQQKERDYTFEGEMNTLFNCGFKPKQVIWLYFKKKKYNFENLAQWESGIGRNITPATALTGYDSDQLEKTMDYCEEMWQGNWSLVAVGNQIANIINKK